MASEERQIADYVLTAEDELIVQKTTEDVDDASRPRCIAIHERMLGNAKRRKSEIERELRSLDRVVAMRSASLAVLRAQIDGSQEGRTDG